MLPITLGSSSVIILKEQDKATSGDRPGPCLRVCFPEKPRCPEELVISIYLPACILNGMSWDELTG